MMMMKLGVKFGHEFGSQDLCLLVRVIQLLIQSEFCCLFNPNNISEVKVSYSTPSSMTSVHVLFLVNGNISSRT